MFEAIQSYLPAEWQRTVEFFGAPLWWIPQWRALMLRYVLGDGGAWETVLRVVFLLPPVFVMLAPLNVVILSDGLPDAGGPHAGDTVGPYGRLNVSALEYLSRNVTVRLLYASPTTGARWERGIERRRVRLWTQDQQVMAGWRAQLAAGQPPEAQDRLWAWISDNVDFRVSARIL